MNKAKHNLNILDQMIDLLHKTMGCCVRLQGCSEVEVAVQQTLFAVMDEKRKIQLESGAGHMVVGKDVYPY